MDLMNDNRVRQFSKLELFARRVVEGFITGLHKSPYHGFSVEFAEHRLYNTGESTKHIDWKLYARTERMFVKRYEEETNLRCMIMIDKSSSMYYPKGEVTKLSFSVHAAAALSHLLRSQRDAVGLSTFGEGVEEYLPSRLSQVHLTHMYTTLQQLLTAADEKKRTSAIDAIHEVANRIHKRSLVVIFSDMLDDSRSNDELIEALQHLRYRHHEVVVFHVMDPRSEIDFEFEDRPHTFIDSETGEKVFIDPSTIRDQYKSRMTAHLHELKVKCGQLHIDFVEVDIQEGFDVVLEKYLVKRKKMTV